MQWPGAAKVQPGLDVKIRKRQLCGNDNADQKADNAPEGSCDGAITDDPVHVAGCVFCHVSAGTGKLHATEQQE